MIFVGDIAHPEGEPPAWGSRRMPWDSNNIVVGNLEGAIGLSDKSMLSRNVLFNDKSILKAFRRVGLRGVCLANNHVNDVDDGIISTRAVLSDAGIAAFGAGGNLSEAAEPAVFSECGKGIAVLAFGWQTIRCRAARASTPGVAPLEWRVMFQALNSTMERYKGCAVVIQVHWNYEMEAHPQPAHRQLAFELIDRGADAVIGHHPHRVSGIEIYNEKPIIYSLGNWWMPHGRYFGGRLAYGPESFRQLAFEWHPDGRMACHWFRYDAATSDISYEGTDDLRSSAVVAKLTPYQGASFDDYVVWFRENRKKKILLPVYRDYRTDRINAMKDAWIRIRHVGVVGTRRLLSKYRKHRA